MPPSPRASAGRGVCLDTMLGYDYCAIRLRGWVYEGPMGSHWIFSGGSVAEDAHRMGCLATCRVGGSRQADASMR
jgi:hypothetical protein